ncbi:hypothetical protein AKJ64_05140 [candidate division MSBL1 archaeon SCGC-AAA259E17]|uniref:CobN/magnesium chelatase domain-containing protein n=1 Tax=candidate division MSBL1 archaeon SCGC-AAA259E17 TaxID=1698263 RepID=A0A133U9P8_9EURY|nr:hypothetical protein AKJ64_05140 [candidate division MSBL1 archaeon SCGC-AAA259E17]
MERKKRGRRKAENMEKRATDLDQRTRVREQRTRFGPSDTEYATFMRTKIEASQWEDEKELVESYDRSMNYAYLGENLQKIEKSPELFKRLTSGIDAVTQVRDNTNTNSPTWTTITNFSEAHPEAWRRKRAVGPSNWWWTAQMRA